jgi:hypothetical protein
MKRSTFIRHVAVLTLLIIIFTVMTSCGEPSFGDFGEFQVEVKEIEINNDNPDKPYIIITYAFTNNSNSAENFMYNIGDTVFQNNVCLKETSFASHPTQTTPVKSGTTYDVIGMYYLQDLTSDIEIELKHYWSEKITTKVFEISE